MKKKTPGAAVPDQSPGSVSESDTIDATSHNRTQDAQEVNTITVNTNVDPELNPRSPQFNPAKYREALSRLDLPAIEARLTAAVKNIAAASEAATAQLTESGIIQKALPEMVIKNLEEILQITRWADATAQAAQKTILSQIKSTLFDEDTAEKLATFIEGLKGTEARIAALESILEKELPAIREQPGLEDTTLEYMLGCLSMDGETIAADTPDGKPIPAAIRAALERAIEAARRAALPSAIAKKADIVEYPMDKPNSKIWSMLQETTGRQLKLAINTAKTGSDKRLNVYYSIDFDELEKNGIKVTKKLLPFDKRVYIAVAALYNAGNTYITLTQIYYAMGNTGKPSRGQLEKISESITKMQGANIFIDNIQESEAYNYLRFHYKGYLLPIEITTATINGQLAESAIRILREPPMMTFAKQRKQITTITVKVLQSPISKTDANLLIDDYLIERIGRAKRGGTGCKILYDTLYENAQITTPKQRQRAPEKIKTYLEHYKSCGMIENYQLLTDGIKIDFAPGL